VTGPPVDPQEVAQRLEAASPGYLDRVRKAARRLSVGAAGDPEARTVLEELRSAAALDLEPPVTAGSARVRAAKEAIRRLVGWYMRYVGQQVVVLGQTTARLGEILVDRADEVDEAVAALRSEVADVRRRLDGLERDRP